MDQQQIDAIIKRETGRDPYRSMELIPHSDLRAVAEAAMRAERERVLEEVDQATRNYAITRGEGNVVRNRVLATIRRLAGESGE